MQQKIFNPCDPLLKNLQESFVLIRNLLREKSFSRGDYWSLFQNHFHKFNLINTEREREKQKKNDKSKEKKKLWEI